MDNREGDRWAGGTGSARPPYAGTGNTGDTPGPGGTSGSHRYRYADAADPGVDLYIEVSTDEDAAGGAHPGGDRPRHGMPRGNGPRTSGPAWVAPTTHLGEAGARDTEPAGSDHWSAAPSEPARHAAVQDPSELLSFDDMPTAVHPQTLPRRRVTPRFVEGPPLPERRTSRHGATPAATDDPYPHTRPTTGPLRAQSEPRGAHTAENPRVTGARPDDSWPRGGAPDDSWPRGGAPDDSWPRGGADLGSSSGRGADAAKSRGSAAHGARPGEGAGGSRSRGRGVDGSWPRGGAPDDSWPRGGAPDDSWPRGGAIDDSWPRGGAVDDSWPRGGAPDDSWPRAGAVGDSWPRGGTQENWPRRGFEIGPLAIDGRHEDRALPPGRTGRTGTELARRPAGHLTRPDTRAEPADEDRDYPAVMWWTGIWYAVVTLVYVLWTSTLSSALPAGCTPANPDCTSLRSEAVAGLTHNIVGLLVALVLSFGVAWCVRRVTLSWRAISVGFAAAVVGAGLATMIASVIG